jgi:hypothetical protein
VKAALHVSQVPKGNGLFLSQELVKFIDIVESVES